MSSNNRTTTAFDQISQGEQTTREYTLERPVENNPYQWEAVDLSNADRVGISLTYVSGGGSMVSDQRCEIVDAENGVVLYSFSRDETFHPAGDYHLQFHIDWADGQTENLPPEGYEIWLNLGRHQGGTPINTPRIRADEGVIDDLRTTDLETDTLKVNEWLSGLHEDGTESQRITRFDGQGLTVGATGSLDVVWPGVDTYPEGGPHNHLTDAQGGDQNYPRDLRVAGQPHHDVTHSDYGAAGDGTADDTAAIQAAIDAAAAAGGGVVYFPPGVYWLSSSTGGLTGASNVSLIGAGRYQSLIKPEFDDDESLRLDEWIRFTDEENIEIAHLGIDGTEARANYLDPDSGDDPNINYTEVIIGPWAKANFRNCDNVVIHDIWADMVKHIADARDGEQIQWWRWTYRDCFNGPHVARCNNVDLAGMIGINCTTVADFASCDDVTATQLNGSCNAWKEDEAIDMGSSTHVTIDSCVFEGFPVAVHVKGEAGGTWSDITLSNIRAYDLTEIGFDVTYGGSTDANGNPLEMGDILIDGCTLEADQSTTDGSYDHPDVDGITVDGPVSVAEIVDTKIDVTGTGISSTGGDLDISGGRTESVSRTSAAVHAYSAGDYIPAVSISDGYFSSQSDPAANGVLEIANSPDLNISGATVRGEGRGGINLTNCQAPTIRDCTFRRLRQNGVRIFYDNETSMTIGPDDIPAVVEGCEFRDWGLGGSLRAAVRFVLNGATAGQYDLLTAKNNQMLVRPNNVADQRGIHIDGSIDTVGNSDLGENIMSNVTGGVTTAAVTLAASVEQDNIVKLA